ncbi:hypothetical protein SAFG77S_13477 [Streptomyces afghaniensis]
MLWFGLKRKLDGIEREMNSIRAKVEKNDFFEQEIQRILLIGEDEEILALVDKFSELNHSRLNSYYDMHKVLDKLDEYTLVGSIARLKGMEEETNSSIDVSPIVAIVASFVTSFVAFNQIAKSILIAIAIMFAVLAIVNIIGNLSKLNRKGRKKLVYFRSLLEHRLKKLKNNIFVDKE